MNVNSTAPNTLSCSATRAAPAALGWLAANSPARPYHIFETVCNLINTEGEVLSLTLAPAEMTPLSLEMKCRDLNMGLTKHIQVNSEVQKLGDQLRVGDLIIQLGTHDRWNPAPDWEKAKARTQESQDLVDEITALLLSDHSPDSLAVLLIPNGFEAQAQASSWLRTAINPIKTLLDGLERLDSNALQGGAGDLAGLGLGLTPSGDDFIIGVMHALWMTLDADRALSLCRKMLSVAAPRTNALSANYLETAARGEAAQAWHTIALAFAQNDTTNLNSAVEKLIELGHTSGQDALSGFLLALAHIPPGSP